MRPMPPIRQGPWLGMHELAPCLVDLRSLDGRSPAGRHLGDATLADLAEEDDIAGRPRAAEQVARVAQDFRRSSRDGDSFELAVGEERHPAPVGRPERRMSNDSRVHQYARLTRFE